MIIFMGLFYLGQTVDFLTILLTGRNLYPTYLYGILSYMWIPFPLIIAMYLGSELMIPEKKWYIIAIFLVLGIIFELFLWLDTLNSFSFTLPNNPGENIIDSNFNRTHPTFFLIVIFLLSILTFNGFGFLYKGIKSTGVIKKRFLLFSTGWIIFVITAGLDSLTTPGIGLIPIRMGMISVSWFFYFGLKKEHARPIKPSTTDDIITAEYEISLIDTLSKLSPAQISEEEVTFYREQTICLVCKGKVEGFNFICPNCKAMYCENCARALIESENACWVCDSPMDKSRPSTPFKKEEKIEKIEKTNRTK